MKVRNVLGLLLLSVILLNISLFMNHHLKQKQYEELKKLYVVEKKIEYTKQNIKAMEDYNAFVDEVLEEYDYLMERE